MIKITPAPFDNALEIEIQGKVEKEDLHHFEEFFMMKRQEHSKVNILLSIENMEGVSLKGALEDLKMTQHLKDIHKMAVVSDKKWVEMGVKLEGLLPETELKHFAPEDKSQAQRWLGT
ncbi:STAS/SEC14 domain-containing protein [Virgibacillus pantothenticus]|uniref:STAS/SEC14 domain-containing protein n=1 Tax=Virgibacillus pantothenticus TaxID=1473 RepID=UPI00098546A2|nr:STAS/SEC14 domain-containing protein [Virgibacillus pantothenticus]